MTRTTVDIDAAVLRELKRRQRREGKTLGRLVSELLAAALARTDDMQRELGWRTSRMEARVDLEDKEALRRALDES
jgi:hypothetical protein